MWARAVVRRQAANAAAAAGRVNLRASLFTVSRGCPTRRFASAAAARGSVTGGGRGGANDRGDGVKFVDPMDKVYGVADFDTNSLRRAKPEPLDPRTFDEFRDAQPEILSLTERKYQTLDPHDYLLDGVKFHPVERSQYVLGSTGEVPHSHTDLANIGKFFPLGSLTEGVAKSLETELEVTDDRLLMVREPAVRVLSALQAFAAGDYKRGPDPAVVLGGAKHTGKSATLAHVVDFARSNGWLTLFVPSMHAILHDSDIMEPSRRRPGFFDQPSFAQDILSKFGAANKTLLSDIPIKTKDDPAADGRLDGYDTLADLVAEASNKDPQIDHVGLVLDLLRELAAVTERNVLLALDDYNQCYQPSTGYFYDSECIRPEQLTLVNALRFFKPVDASKPNGAHAFAPEYPLRNGVVVAAESHHRVLSREDQKEFKPVWKAISQAAPRVAHGRYSLSEVESCMRHYFCHDLCFQEPTESAVRTLHLLTDGNPGELLLRSSNPASFHVSVHLPGGQPGARHNQWRSPR
eukprot:INCI8759.1.p1 GENE.INCI8759.1~~INCI8759.1.p1  ORF type:complete len:521 (+),score=91.75 INCI8759.1:176-1738(+)